VREGEREGGGGVQLLLFGEGVSEADERGAGAGLEADNAVGRGLHCGGDNQRGRLFLIELLSTGVSSP